MKQFGGRMFNLNQVFHKGFESKGVGLFISKNQIESLGGTIRVKSKVNEGTTFIVAF
jgi:signal transduction histidine kinase